MNDFIVEISSAWKNGSPYDHKKSYLGISNDDVVAKSTRYPGFTRQVRFN